MMNEGYERNYRLDAQRYESPDSSAQVPASILSVDMTGAGVDDGCRRLQLLGDDKDATAEVDPLN